MAASTRSDYTCTIVSVRGNEALVQYPNVMKLNEASNSNYLSHPSVYCMATCILYKVKVYDMMAHY